MLYIDYGVDGDKLLKYPGPSFDYTYENSWFTDKFVLEMIETIDKTKHIEDAVFLSQFGAHTAKQLSGGVKTLILMYMDEFHGMYYPLSWLGENCYRFLDRVSESHDIYIRVDTIPTLKELGCMFISQRTGSKITTSLELTKEYSKYVKLC